ncbi:hypothetical protein PTTG_27058 [Puccinia triticina 1-1 BBBD Race 1]|uniref:U1-type domain-containing protein n=1 Tax=Puccinia triticina (isolate 1-1 / race 1 (BBBD)) TaxID=630390 RepID=A0A180GNT2_PUCT1|nr:hypothetical protein PTTG_27058 [Puccinia triticina 1-1 BBBD Race 1]
MALISRRTCGCPGGDAIGLRHDGIPEASVICPGVAKLKGPTFLMKAALRPQRCVSGSPSNPKDYTLEGGLYFCNVCPRARGAKSWTLHARTPAHQTNIRRRNKLRQRTAPAPPQPASVGDPNPDDSHPQLPQGHQDAAYEQRVWAM